jgi:hypothetical protein
MRYIFNSLRRFSIHEFGSCPFASLMRKGIKRFIKDEKQVLGRWNIDSCDKKTNTKVDWSNEDHCGPCGQYLLSKTVTKLPNK